MVRKQVNSCDVKLFTVSEMFLECECSERRSIVAVETNAGLKTVAILHFCPSCLPPFHPLAPHHLNPDPDTRSSLFPPPLAPCLFAAAPIALLLCFKWQLCADGSCVLNSSSGKLALRLEVLLCH